MRRRRCAARRASAVATRCTRSHAGDRRGRAIALSRRGPVAPQTTTAMGNCVDRPKSAIKNLKNGSKN
eukprot:6267470-Prymnesium_polylepis.1